MLSARREWTFVQNNLTKQMISRLPRELQKQQERHLDSLWTMTSEKCIKLLHDLLLKCKECSRKHKPETWVLAALKPGFRVWQNGRVSPGPGFFKTRVSIPSVHQLTVSSGLTYFSRSQRSKCKNQILGQPGWHKS